MKRRFFTAGLGAVALAPSLPVASITQPTLPANVQFWAKYFAKLPGHSPVRGLQIALKMPAAQAREAVGVLVHQGVIARPNAKPQEFRGLRRYFEVRLDVPLDLQDLRTPTTCSFCDGTTDLERMQS